jgi:hypothetical protein
MIGELARKVALSATVLVLGVGGSAVFAGTALAGGCGCNSESHAHYIHHSSHHTYYIHYTHNKGGNGGKGGSASANCAVPVGVSAGVIGQGGNVSQCNAVGGAGGAGGNG